MSDAGNDLSGFSMLDLFRTEVENQATILNQGLLALESEPNSPKVIESLMRAAHSIKGAARIVQLEDAVRVSHVLEDCFVAAQSGKIALQEDHMDVLLRGIDILIQISNLPESGMEQWRHEHRAEVDHLIAEIVAVTNATHRVSPSTVAETRSRKPEQLTEKTQQAIVAPEGRVREQESKSFKQEIATAETDRTVRVTAEHLNRLMGLAGEAMLSANAMQAFTDSLLHLKNSQYELGELLHKLQQQAEKNGASAQWATYIVEAAQKLDECRSTLSNNIAELETFSRQSANLTNRLYREVIASRMRPFSDGVHAFPRMVRDLARKLGKKLRFEISGKTTRVDRDILEKLEAPLNHLLRNALDHGIELPEERIAAGKSPEGRLTLEARHRAGMLYITVADDGKGIDLNRLREKLSRRKLVSAEMAQQLQEAELLEFLFLPGFSTSDSVTEISGRGVGLDVVQSMVQEVGGSVRAVSHPGAGMTFHLQLPLTLSVIRALIVKVAGEPYAFPLSRIDRSLIVSRKEILTLENREYIALDGQNVGLVAARQILELPESAMENDDRLAILIISDQLNRYGVVVDSFLGQRDLVVRPLDARLGKVPDIHAVALMDDGSPVLMIDVQDMVRSIDNLLHGNRLAKLRSVETISSGKRKRILVVDDSITVREVERKILENHGYEVEVAVNGMDGWNAVRTTSYDLVITDIDMPRMNGFELVTRIKQDPRLRNIPVMIISYKEREEDRVKGLDAGANYYLTKSSFHDEKMMDAVVDLIGEA